MPYIQLIAIGIGASLGAWFRWGLSHWLNSIHPILPIGTLSANVIGGFCIGGLIPLAMLDTHLSQEMRLGLITGFLGALTTFSTFSAETMQLLARKEYLWAGVCVGGHLGGSLCATALGWWIVRGMLR